VKRSTFPLSVCGCLPTLLLLLHALSFLPSLSHSSRDQLKKKKTALQNKIIGRKKKTPLHSHREREREREKKVRRPKFAACCCASEREQKKKQRHSTICTTLGTF
jgi:hypothetical protein